MTLYLDRHDEITATPEEVARLHSCDMDVQAKFGVKYLTYWYQHGHTAAFCLVEAPSKEAAEAVHREAHGNIASQIIEVDRQSVEVLFGPIKEPQRGEAWEDVSLRTVLCTRLGAAEPRESTEHEPREETPGLDRVVRQALDVRGGREVAFSSGSMMGLFASVSGALECALAIQKSFAPIASVFQHARVLPTIGLHAGEPVTHHLELFGEATQVASELRARARPGEILVSEEVRDACQGRGFIFTKQGEAQFGGREGSLRFFSVAGKEELSTDLLVSLPGASQRPYPDGLSQREVEVVGLISLGKTNQEIADQLVISLNTVATHVRSILEKTDSANRAEAACYALRKRLV